MRTLVALAVIALVSCTGRSPATATPKAVASPTPTVSNSAESKAADFRIRLDLLLGEHVIIIARESATPTRQAEYAGYLRLLIANGADLTELMRAAMGNSAAARFEPIWSSQNDFIVSYTIGLVTHNQAKASSSLQSLTVTFVPQFSQFLSDVTHIPLELILPLITQNMLEIRALLDDQFHKSYPALYADLRTSYAHAMQVGDAVAPKIAQRFPDKFPGNASSPAADLRASVNFKLQEHSYLSTMRSSAAIGGRAKEQAAAAGALVENANALHALFTDLFGAPAATRFDRVWAAGNAATFGYASASTAAAKRRALRALTDASVAQLSGWLSDTTGLAVDASRPSLEARLEAVVTVIADQRSRAWSRLAADDRSAATATEVVADLVALAAIAKLPAMFG